MRYTIVEHVPRFRCVDCAREGRDVIVEVDEIGQHDALHARPDLFTEMGKPVLVPGGQMQRDS